MMSTMCMVVMSPKGASCRFIVYSEVLHQYKIAGRMVCQVSIDNMPHFLLDEQTYCLDVQMHISNPFPFLCP